VSDKLYGIVTKPVWRNAGSCELRLDLLLCKKGID